MISTLNKSADRQKSEITCGLSYFLFGTKLRIRQKNWTVIKKNAKMIILCILKRTEKSAYNKHIDIV